MIGRKVLKPLGLFTLVVILSVFMVRQAAAALTLENVTAWQWISATSTLSVDVGDVDGDGDAEIVTGGVYFDGTRNNAQLCVWSGPHLALETVRTWYWIGETWILSVDVGDVDNDGDVEIVTGGYYFDGTRNNAQLCVWDGSSLALEGVTTWCWSGGATIWSVAVGDVDDDGDVEIVTGGHIDIAPSVTRAQLCVWDGSSLALESVTTWYWISATYIYSVAVGDVDDDASTEIVTGGYYFDGTRNNAQLCVWDGSSLALESVTTWYWIDNTQIWYSMGIDDVDGDGFVEIVTGGSYYDGTRDNAQLCVWNGSTLALESVTTWYWTSYTRIFSVDVGDVDGDGDVEIATGGNFLGAGWYAQLAVWIMHAIP